MVVSENTAWTVAAMFGSNVMSPLKGTLMPIAVAGIAKINIEMSNSAICFILRTLPQRMRFVLRIGI